MRSAPLLAGLAVAVSTACAHETAFTPAASLTSLPVGDRCLEREADDSCARYVVSIYELLVRPTEYHQKPVLVEGYLSLEFEGNVLCPTDARHSGADCLWVDVDGVDDPGFRKGYASVEGTFDGELRGHLWCCAGTITGITRLRHLE